MAIIQRTLLVRCQYVPLTHCVQNVNTRNRSPLDMACVPHTYAVSVTRIFSAHARSYPSVEIKRSARNIQKHKWTKKMFLFVYKIILNTIIK